MSGVAKFAAPREPKKRTQDAGELGISGFVGVGSGSVQASQLFRCHKAFAAGSMLGRFADQQSRLIYKKTCMFLL